MKITFTNGITVEIADGVEIGSAALSVIASLAGADIAPTVLTADPVTLVTEDVPPSSHGLPSRSLRTVYLTAVEALAMETLQGFPEGVSSRDVAALMDTTWSTASSAIWRLKNRPTKSHPLVERIPATNLFRPTALGCKIRIEVSERPTKPNLKLGWR